MNGISPFKKGGEYLTFLFHKDGEEHLVPRSLFPNSHKFQHLVDHNNEIKIENIASSTFFDLTNFLSGNHQKVTPEMVQKMIEAATVLGLVDTVKDLSRFFTRVDA